MDYSYRDHLLYFQGLGGAGFRLSWTSYHSLLSLAPGLLETGYDARIISQKSDAPYRESLPNPPLETRVAISIKCGDFLVRVSLPSC